jgi:hypothetical protein
MSYSVIYERFQIILDNSQLKEILCRSPYMNMDISSENQNMQNLCRKRMLVHFTENVFVGVLDTGVSRSTCSWAPSTAQLRPRGGTKTEARRIRPS